MGIDYRVMFLNTVTFASILDRKTAGGRNCPELYGKCAKLLSSCLVPSKIPDFAFECNYWL
jgi:hypothetical protein